MWTSLNREVSQPHEDNFCKNNEKIPKLCLGSLATEFPPPKFISLPKQRSGRFLSADKKIAEIFEEYRLHDCRADANQQGSWVVRNKRFTSKVVKEMPLLINELKTSKFPSKKIELKLLECQITSTLIKNLLHSDLSALHIQQCVLNPKMADIFKRFLCISKLETLILVGVKIAPYDLEKIVDGLVAQNENSCGVKEVHIIACSVDVTYSKALKKLAGNCRHLEKINLSSNRIGSNYRVKMLPLPSIVECLEKDEKTFAEICKTPEKKAVLSKPISAIQSVLAGVFENKINNGNLELIILADNGLNQVDRNLLIENKDSKVLYNIAQNEFKKENGNRHIAYCSPRNVAVGNEAPKVPRRTLCNENTHLAYCSARNIALESEAPKVPRKAFANDNMHPMYGFSKNVAVGNEAPKVPRKAFSKSSFQELDASKSQFQKEKLVKEDTL